MSDTDTDTTHQTSVSQQWKKKKKKNRKSQINPPFCVCPAALCPLSVLDWWVGELHRQSPSTPCLQISLSLGMDRTGRRQVWPLLFSLSLSLFSFLFSFFFQTCFGQPYLPVTALLIMLFFFFLIPLSLALCYTVCIYIYINFFFCFFTFGLYSKYFMCIIVLL